MRKCSWDFNKILRNEKEKKNHQLAADTDLWKEAGSGLKLGTRMKLEQNRADADENEERLKLCLPSASHTQWREMINDVLMKAYIFS